MKTTKIKRNLVGLGGLRESFGLNQKLMAMYLQINISTLKLVETGRRSLPTHALIAVANLEIQLACKQENADYNIIHPLEHVYAAAIKEKYQLLTAREKKCRAERDLLGKQLDLMKGNYQKLRIRLQVIETIIAQNNEMETELRGWQKEKDIVATLLSKCSLPLQLLTQTRLHMVESEIDLYNKLHLQLATELPGFLSHS
jgi:transcriptional regulator with XRE-family HTH domain